MANGKVVPRIRKAYDGSRVGETVGGGESMVRQAFKDECDINRILERYKSTGLTPVNRREPMFADVSMLTDLKSALDLLEERRHVMRKLPREARELLRKDPEAFFGALDNVTVREDLVKLGVLAPEPEAPVVPPVVPPVAAPPSGAPPAGAQ